MWVGNTGPGGTRHAQAWLDSEETVCVDAPFVYTGAAARDGPGLKVLPERYWCPALPSTNSW